jgi:hypothetical protein
MMNNTGRNIKEWMDKYNLSGDANTGAAEIAKLTNDVPKPPTPGLDAVKLTGESLTGQKYYSNLEGLPPNLRISASGELLQKPTIEPLGLGGLGDISFKQDLNRAEVYRNYRDSSPLSDYFKEDGGDVFSNDQLVGLHGDAQSGNPNALFVFEELTRRNNPETKQGKLDDLISIVNAQTAAGKVDTPEMTSLDNMNADLEEEAEKAKSAEEIKAASNKFSFDLPTDIAQTKENLSKAYADSTAFFQDSKISYTILEGNVRPTFYFNGNALSPGDELFNNASNAYDVLKLSQKIIQEQAKTVFDAESSKAIDSLTSSLDRESARLTRDANKIAADKDRALQQSNLDESIRVNRLSESINMEKREHEKKLEKLSFLMQLASNPAMLFFMKQQGLTGQFESLLGMAPGSFLKNIGGSPSMQGGFNAQSWARLSPEQQKTVIASIQASTGQTPQEIVRGFTSNTPGSGASSMQRGTR